MAAPGIQYEAPTVSEIFGPGFVYTVPAYQRGYAWTDEQVSQLVEDTIWAYRNTPQETYLLGQVILCPGKESGYWEIVDGQQRITTLFVLIAAAREIVNEMALTAALDPGRKIQFDQVTGMLFHVVGHAIQPRLTAARDGNEYIQRIMDGSGFPAEDASPTQQNIREAYDKIRELLSKEFDSGTEIFDYLWHLLQKVVLFRLTLSDSNQALRVFAKMNNRGLTLDDADLLKNLLFQKVTSDEEFDKLSSEWDDASKNLYKSRLKRVRSMEFLMKTLVGIETGESISTSGVFERWEKILNTEEKAKEFASSLPNRAKHLQRLATGRTPADAPAVDNHGSFIFKWVQHLEVLLAGDHLSAESYSHLAKIVEERVVLSLLGSEKNQKFESMVHKWSNKVSQLHNLATRAQIVEASKDALVNLDELLELSRIGISNLNYEVQSHRLKMRYVLARVARAVQIEAEEATDQAELSEFMKVPAKNVMGYHLDHVFPQAAGQRQHWDSQEKEYLIHRIGNLVLLHGGDNQAQADALPWDQQKIQSFAASALIVNRMLCDAGALGEMPNRIREVVEASPVTPMASLSNWGSADVEARFNLYWHYFEAQVRKNLKS